MPDDPTPIVLLLAATCLLLPLLTAVAIVLCTRRRLFVGAGMVATINMAVGLGCSLGIANLWLSRSGLAPISLEIPWIPLPGLTPAWLYLGILVDGLTVAMLLVVTGISFLVHLYSLGYMAKDPRKNLFFAYLSLFTFAMLGVVLSPSLIMIFVFWELVGLTSYLLIGFWFEKPAPQAACTKAFVMNRMGDAGLLVGMGILFYQLGGQLLLPANSSGQTLTVFQSVGQLIQHSGQSIHDPPIWLTVAGICLFMGAMGKSAQFPLHTWLPDAMEGPTPVSSIVHSATMVAAGVYLTARLYPILTPAAHVFIVTIGLITLIIGALMALVATDIKRVLAFSTMSQLGYMVLGLGVGAYTFALLHLITHAFFKCCLFQCAGSVIHAAHHQQDVRRLGGLYRKLPITALCFAVCMLAIAGASVPMTEWGVSGFYSKDGILAAVVNYAEISTGLGVWADIIRWAPMAVAYVTVFYMTRLFVLTFLGSPRDQQVYDHAHEAPWTMWLPQVVLAMLAVVSTPWALSLWQQLINQSLSVMQNSGSAAVQGGELHELGHGLHAVHSGLLHGWAWLIVMALAVLFYIRGLGVPGVVAGLPVIRWLHRWLLERMYFDALYDRFMVALVRTVAGICMLMDRYVVDALVNLCGSLGLTMAARSRRFDQEMVDQVFEGSALLAQSAGQGLQLTQPGRLRVYILLTLSTLVVLTIVLIVTVSLAPA